MPPLYLDYVGKGCWALGYDKEMNFPRFKISLCPNKLIQEYRYKYSIVLSEAAELIVDNNMCGVNWVKAYNKMLKYPHPECKES